MILNACTIFKAKKYYSQKDPIYTKDNAIWLGGGSESLGITEGDWIKEENFNNAVEGNDFTGLNQVRHSYNTPKGRMEHCAGYDLPLSNPKGVSILEHIGKDTRIRQAGARSIAEVVKHIDNNYIAYNEIVNKKSSRVEAPGKGIFAVYSHSISRANDPHSHTHVFIVNMVAIGKGRFRALAPRAIYNNVKEFTAIYNATMCKELSKMGYAIENTGKGFYDVAGISKELKEIFSKRHQQVADMHEKLKAQGKLGYLSEAALKNIAEIESRPPKSPVTETELHKSWDYQMEKIGYSADKFISETQTAAERRVHSIISVSDCIRIAAQDLSMNESTFRMAQINRGALSLGMGKFTLTDIREGFDKILQEGSVRQIGEDVYSTPEMIRIEQEMINKLKAGADRLDPVMKKEEAYAFLNSYENRIKKHDLNFRLTAGQKDLLMNVLSSRDQFILAQGYTRSGKKTVLRAVAEAAKNIDIMWLSNTGEAIQNYTNKTSFPSHPPAKSLEPETGLSIPIRVIDEAPVMSSRDMDKALELALKDNVRAVFIGDMNQLLPTVDAQEFKGSPILCGLKIIEMEESLRQIREFAKALAGCIRNKDIASAFEMLKGKNRIYEADSLDKRLIRAKDLFMENPNKSAVITNFNRDRKLLNNMIRSELQARNLIESNSHKLHTRTPISIMDRDKKYASSYSEATHLSSRSAVSKLPAGSEIQVTRVDIDRNMIFGKTSKGAYQVDLLKYGHMLRAFEENLKDFAVGDHIVFTKYDTYLGLENGMAGVIKEISRDGIMVVESNWKKFKIDSKSYNYFDHGYVIAEYNSEMSTHKKCHIFWHSKNY